MCLLLGVDPWIVGLRINTYAFMYYNVSLHSTAAPTFAASTVKTPERRVPTATSSSTSDRGRHSNLLVILGIVTGILIMSIICVLILCLCTLRPKTKRPTETGKFSSCDCYCIYFSFLHFYNSILLVKTAISYTLGHLS